MALAPVRQTVARRRWFVVFAVFAAQFDPISGGPGRVLVNHGPRTTDHGPRTKASGSRSGDRGSGIGDRIALGGSWSTQGGSCTFEPWPAGHGPACCTGLNRGQKKARTWRA